MPSTEKLGVLVCERLHSAAVELVEAGRLASAAPVGQFDDVRLIPFSGDCTRQLDGWQEIERVAATADDCQQLRVLAGACVPDLAPADVSARQLSIVRRCEGLPRALSDAGRERLGLLIEKTALEWRLEFQRTRLNAILASAYRRLTDSGMVQELVSGLADTLAEEKVVEKVFNLFATILAPATMVFAALEDGKLHRVWSRPAGFGESEEVKQRLASFNRSHAWTESGAGFRLSLRHRTKTLGVLEVEGVSFSEYRDHYLDMALVVARTSALAIADARLYRDLKGPSRTYLGFAEDLQDALLARKRAEEKQAQLLKQVEAANQELADFAHVVSHDLKAPLRAIDSLLKWLVTDYSERFDSEGKEMVNLLLARVKRMHDLIDGILQYSRAGRALEQIMEVDLGAVVPEVIAALAPPDNVSISFDGGFPVVRASRVKLEQVFQNLLSNAIKYSDKPQGLIRVGCSEEGGYWKFGVSDNGPGIADKDQERVFQLFQTLKPRDQSDSTGVGLAVVKKIVEGYGGKVWVESRLGEGSTFYFTLPKPTGGAKG
jgi:signal transduction histidine kinase